MKDSHSLENQVEVKSPKAVKKIHQEPKSIPEKTQPQNGHDVKNLIREQAIADEKKLNNNISSLPSNPFINQQLSANSIGLSLPSSLQVGSQNSSIEEQKMYDITETPKFPMESQFQIMDLGVNKKIDFAENKFNKNGDRFSKKKGWPSFETTYKCMSPERIEMNFPIGTESVLLREALGMKSDLDPPPYLKSLIKVGLPNYCMMLFLCNNRL